MNYTQSRELKENNRIYREMESIYHEICVKAGISDTDFIVLYSIVEFEDGCCQREIAKTVFYQSADSEFFGEKISAKRLRCIGKRQRA